MESLTLIVYRRENFNTDVNERRQSIASRRHWKADSWGAFAPGRFEWVSKTRVLRKPGPRGNSECGPACCCFLLLDAEYGTAAGQYRPIGDVNRAVGSQGHSSWHEQRARSQLGARAVGQHFYQRALWIPA